MIVYSRSYSWNGTTIQVDGHMSAEEATQHLAYQMLLSGYKIPKWYEISRWFENRPAPDLRAAIKNQLSLIGD